MSFGGFGASNTPASGGFGGFGTSGTSGGFGSSAAASPFGGGAASGGFGSGTSTFGAGAAKPAFGGFGATAPATGSGFGAQQTTTTGFGGFGASATAPSTGFGAAANTATTTGFGNTLAFGGGAATGGFGSSGTSAFGASTPFGAKPTTSPSPFGSTSAFGGGAGTTSTFGGGASTGGFGTPTPASGGMFGNTAAGGFGASTAKSPFGATSVATTGGFGTQTTAPTSFGSFGSQPAAGAVPAGQVQVGTGQPPYQPTREMEPSGTGGTANYISISRMPAYAHKSVEELRYEDYLKRTNPAAAQAAATQNVPASGAAFGGFGAQPATSSSFGATGGFGTGQPSAFGAPSGGGGFGSSAFGSTTTASTTGGFGSFGSQPGAPATSGGMFGSASTQPATGGFGTPAASSAFGAAPGASSAFGATTMGGGFGATPGGFGSSFGATPAIQPQTSAFGSFGATAPASTSGFGASGFGKPAASSGFGGFGATTAPAPTSATGGFGFGAPQSQVGATTSFFGGTGATAPASTGFSFGGSTPKPAASGGFGFGSTGGTGAFGNTSGSAFGATTVPSAFGTTPAQTAPGTNSLFSSTGAAAGSTGGFGFGSTPSTAPGSTTSVFGAAKPASTNFFGSSGTSTPGFFNGGANASGSSLFSAPSTATSTGSTGFSFGGGSGGFGGTSTGGFGGFSGFGSSATPAAQTGTFGTTGSMFGQPQQQAQATVAQPQNLVAAPDVNPYGAGSFGAGLVEQNVKAALDLQTIKTGSSASSRLITFADDVGLPRGPLDSPLVTRRQTISSRHAIPVSFTRGLFKGSKSRFSRFTPPALSTALSSGSRLGSNGDGSSNKEDEFKFTSSLFRKSVTKKLVIAKEEQSSGRDTQRSSHVSIVPMTDKDRVDAYELGNAHSRLLKAGDDGKYSVGFCNQTNKKTFTLRLYSNQTVKQARNEVKQLLRESSTATSSSIADVELVLRGRMLHDDKIIEELQLKEEDCIGVVVIENRLDEKKREDQSASISSLSKVPEVQLDDEPAPPKRFMTYDEYLASAGRDEDDLLKSTKANHTGLTSPVSSSCPTLKNKDYYTFPSYERLQAMTNHELSEVDKFTVGCHGLGAVEWIGKTDVRDLNLDELVLFEKKEVIVYKDDEKKHELGKGLNKPAIIELLGIFPPRKSTSPEKYKERVKQRTRDIGATFLDYSTDKGIWRFRVEHFSRYAFDDDDDDDEDVDMDGPNDAADAHSKELAIKQLPRKAAMTRGPRASRAKMPFSADRSELFRRSCIYGGDMKSKSVVASFGNHSTSVAINDKWVEVNRDLESVVPETKLLTDFDATEEVLASKKDQRPTSEVFPVIPYTIKPLGVDSTDCLPAEGKSTTYQMMLQASGQKLAKVVRSNVDGGMFMARSFRCSWGPNGELVNLGKLVTRSGKHSDVQSNGRRICIEFPLRLDENRKADLHEGLKLHYDCTSHDRDLNDLDREESEAPIQYALPLHEPLMNCLHKYVALAESRAQNASSGSYEKLSLLVWKLIQALWGQEHGAKMGDRCGSVFYPLASRDDPNEVETLDTFQTIDLRREGISQWFETALNDAEVMTGTPSPEGVLRLLCQHRIVEAADMATDCGDLRLATIIAQAASYEGTDFRSLMEAQMAQWTDNGSLEFMDKSLVLVYSLLSGSVEVLSAHKGASMSWIACLALILWYKRGPASSLKPVMALYEDFVSKQRASSSLSKFAAAGTDKDDVLMELMKLYIEDVSSLCKVLSPSGFMTQDFCHLDYELSWHMHSVLRAIGYKLDRQWESHIHQNFIRQLEGIGLWEDAVYVALNISDVTERETTCRELLLRNADALAMDASIRESLCERLHLPTEWVSEALAVKAIVMQNYHEEIAHWVAARHYEEAHACLISHVAMRCLFTGEKGSLMQLLLELEPMSVYIPQWKSCERVDAIGGGLVLEYLRLEQQKGLEVGHEDQFLQRVMLLSRQLSSARDASAKDVGKKRGKDALLAQTCVSSMIVSLATQAVQLRSLLSYAQEREQANDASPMSMPLELEPEFLGGLSHLVTGRETSFVESYRTSQLMHLCSTFIDWRA